MQISQKNPKQISFFTKLQTNENGKFVSCVLTFDPIEI